MTTAAVRDLVTAGRGGWVPRGLVGPTADELRTICADSGWAFAEVTLNGVVDKKGLMRTLAQQLGLPDHFGHNWDALADCLADLAPEAPGVVLRLRQMRFRYAPQLMDAHARHHGAQQRAIDQPVRLWVAAHHGGRQQTFGAHDRSRHSGLNQPAHIKHACLK